MKITTHNSDGTTSVVEYSDLVPEYIQSYCHDTPIITLDEDEFNIMMTCPDEEYRTSLSWFPVPSVAHQKVARYSRNIVEAYVHIEHNLLPAQELAKSFCEVDHYHQDDTHSAT